MGVNRAYPYAKIEKSELGEHIDTMYKLVHVCSFNIGLQTLSLLYQIVGHSNDRSVLLSKSQIFYFSTISKIFKIKVNNLSC